LFRLTGIGNPVALTTDFRFAQAERDGDFGLVSQAQQPPISATD
jgi:hypothetical protein